MRLRNLALPALASIIFAGAASAAPLQGAQGAACDFFQAQLVGLLCGGTGYFAPEIGGSDLTRSRTTTIHRGFRGEGASTRTDHWDDRTTYEDATIAVSPWQGVRFHVTGEAFQYNDRDAYDIQGGGPHGGGHRGDGFDADLPTGFGGGGFSGVAT